MWVSSIPTEQNDIEYILRYSSICAKSLPGQEAFERAARQARNAKGGLKLGVDGRRALGGCLGKGRISGARTAWFMVSQKSGFRVQGLGFRITKI